MDYQAAGMNGHVQHRIRTPHPHDVLSGRGGGINSHVGNITFRQWVAERKNDYNLAPSKAEKSRVAQEVIDLVQNQNPPGRFLQKDPSGAGAATSYWVELDEERLMAKTSQALREGAPQIRAAHRDELEENRIAGRRRKKPSMATRQATTAEPIFQTYNDVTSSLEPVLTASKNMNWMQQRAVAELQANVESAKRLSQASTSTIADSDEEWKPPGKKVRLDYRGQTVTPQEASPPLSPTSTPNTIWPPVMDLAAIPAPPKHDVQSLHRAHSLALSDLATGGDWATEEFVNPFANDSDVEKRLQPNTHSSSDVSDSLPMPRPGVLHETSTTSNGDMGGIGALTQGLRSQSTSSSSANSPSKLRWSRSSFGSLSNLDSESSNGNLPEGSKSADKSWWDWGSEAAPVSP